LADRFSFQPELLYSSQGFQFSSDLSAIQNNGAIANQNDFRTNVQFNYLTVPLLAKFSLKDRLAVEFGPQLGFLLNQVTKIKNLNQRDEPLPDNRTSTSGNFQLDYGVAAGLAYNFSESVSIQPRFYFGLRNRLNGLENMLQSYNVTIQVSANYTF
jgi:hypothetical protein